MLHSLSRCGMLSRRSGGTKEWFILLILLGTSSQGLAVELFDFSAAEDLYRNDDDYFAVHPAIPYPFYGRQHSTFYIGNNGIVTFVMEPHHYIGQTFPFSVDYQMIAPFYMDVDTRAAGTVWHQEISDPEVFRRVDDIIHRVFASEQSFSSLGVYIVTWDEVGYYERRADRLNTFQCVMATDSIDLYVFFLYSDIQWIQLNNSIIVQIGFNAGNGIDYYSIPDSGTEAMMNITRTSNVGVPGMWVFKASEAVIRSHGCHMSATSSEGTSGHMSIYPNYGNQLGGDLISVRGPCFSPSANIQCVFNEETRVALYQSESVVYCVTPRLSRKGSVTFRLLIDGQSQGETIYTALSIERTYQVDIAPPPSSSSLPLVLGDNDTFTLTWSPHSIFPQVNPDLDPFNLSVILYTLDVNSDRWVMFGQKPLLDNILNDGSERVTLPAGISNDITPIAIQVATSLSPNIRFNNELLYVKLYRSQQRVGIWTSELYYISPRLAGINRRMECLKWYQEESQSPPVSGGVHCAPTLDRAQLPTSGLSEDVQSSVSGNWMFRRQWLQTFHPGAQKCFIQRVVDTSSENSATEQECCYNSQNILLTMAPNGGSLNRVSKYFSRSQHFLRDIKPYFLCCTGHAPNCALYYEKRPSDDGRQFELPTPAWMIGDPHMVTLDGLRYTFNGQGEFTLLQTIDSSFTLQGRMTPLLNNSRATVFSAVAANISTSDENVMITQSARGLDAYVRNERVNFQGNSEQEFNQFVITKRNNTMIVSFTKGVYLECRVEGSQGLMTTVIVGVPRSFINKTKGLLGVFNGVKDDDLTPRLSGPVPINSSLQDIHHRFGLSWLIREPEESLFTYLPHENHTLFSNASYQPLFDVSGIERSVLELCKNDSFCVYDYIVTGDSNFGLRTLTSVSEATQVDRLVERVSCDPQCTNGICLPGNECSCPDGYFGSRCHSVQIISCVSINPCGEDEMCMELAGSYICVQDCESNPSGKFCNPTSESSFPITNTATVIIAVSCVGVGILLIICLGILILICVRQKKNNSTNGSKNSINGVVDSAQRTSAITLDEITKENDTTLNPPTYSEIMDNGQVPKINYVPRTDASENHAAENHYVNYVNKPEELLPPRRASLGAVHQVPLKEAFHTQSHNIINVSTPPNSGEVNTRHDADDEQAEHDSTSNVQANAKRRSSVQEPWYRTSSPSIGSYRNSLSPNTISPPPSTTQLHSALSKPDHSSQTLPHNLDHTTTRTISKRSLQLSYPNPGYGIESPTSLVRPGHNSTGGLDQSCTAV